MMAITIYQPWASLIIAGAKTHEFRSWRAWPHVIGRRVVIHASARAVNVAEVWALLRAIEGGDAQSLGLLGANAAPILRAVADDPRSIPIGAGIGTARIGQPDRIAQWSVINPLVPLMADRQDRWAWPMERPRRWREPIMARGHKGFWAWPERTRDD